MLLSLLDLSGKNNWVLFPFGQVLETKAPPKVAWNHFEGIPQSFSTHPFPAVCIECCLPGCSSGSLLAFRQDLSDALLLVNPRRDELRQREVCVVIRYNVW